MFLIFYAKKEDCLLLILKSILRDHVLFKSYRACWHFCCFDRKLTCVAQTIRSVVKSINLSVFKSVHSDLELSYLCSTHCLIWDVGSGLAHGSVAYLSACCLDAIHTCTAQRGVHKHLWGCFPKFITLHNLLLFPILCQKSGFATYFPHLCL